MAKFITDGVFGPLARRLNSIDVDRTYRQSLEVAADEGAEMLRMELQAEGAPREIAAAVRPFPVVGHVAAAGIRDENPVSDDALEWEYGAMDGSTPPHATFRFVADDMADVATEEAARRFSEQIVGVS